MQDSTCNQALKEKVKKPTRVTCIDIICCFKKSNPIVAEVKRRHKVQTLSPKKPETVSDTTKLSTRASSRDKF